MISCGPSGFLAKTLARSRTHWSTAEVLARSSPVPKAAGVYAWYFRGLDSLIPSLDCIGRGQFMLTPG
jgi:hypothetical protein